MSGVVKFLKSLVSSEPAASKVISKTPNVSQAAVAVDPSAISPDHSSCTNNSSIQTVKPHVPLIKFRKGGPASGHSVVTGAASPASISGHAVISRGTIEDYQLPPRYQRIPLDDKEIDYINRGGPE